MDTPQVLLNHHLKTLRLPTFLRASTTKSRSSVPQGAWIFRVTCCD